MYVLNDNINLKTIKLISYSFHFPEKYSMFTLRPLKKQNHNQFFPFNPTPTTFCAHILSGTHIIQNILPTRSFLSMAYTQNYRRKQTQEHIAFVPRSPTRNIKSRQQTLSNTFWKVTLSLPSLIHKIYCTAKILSVTCTAVRQLQHAAAWNFRSPSVCPASASRRWRRWRWTERPPRAPRKEAGGPGSGRARTRRPGEAPG